MTNGTGQINQPLKLRFDSGPTTVDLLTLDSVDGAVGNGAGINFTNSTNNAEGSFLVLGRIRAWRADADTARLDLMINPALASDNAQPALSILGGRDAAGATLPNRVEVAGALSVAGATTLGGTLSVTGAGSFPSLTVSGKLGVGLDRPALALDVAGQGLFRSAAWAGPPAGVMGLTVGFDPNNAGGTGFIYAHNVQNTATRLWLDGNPLIFAPGGTERARIDSSGRLGIGTTAPQRLLHVEGSEIHSGGASAGFSFSNRGSPFVNGGGSGDRWVLYAHDRTAMLWSGSDHFFFNPQGEFGRGHASATLCLWGSRLSDTGDGRLRIRSGGNTVAFDGGDNVGIGLIDPRTQLHVLRGIATGLDFNSAGSVTFYPPDGYAWFHIDNGPAGGRSIGTLRISHGGSPGTYMLMSLAQNGDVSIPGRLIASRKVGFVADKFVNNLGVSLEAGDVVVIGADQSTLYYPDAGLVPAPEVDRGEQAYDTRVCGVVLEAYAAGRHDAPLGGGDAPPAPEVFEPGRVTVEPGQVGLMVTMGAVAACKVDADIAPIQPGDLLTTSPTPGHAQKVLDRAQATGAILGKALGSLEQGRGTIAIFVSCQ